MEKPKTPDACMPDIQLSDLNFCSIFEAKGDGVFLRPEALQEVSSRMAVAHMVRRLVNILENPADQHRIDQLMLDLTVRFRAAEKEVIEGIRSGENLEEHRFIGIKSFFEIDSKEELNRIVNALLESAKDMHLLQMKQIAKRIDVTPAAISIAKKGGVSEGKLIAISQVILDEAKSQRSLADLISRVHCILSGNKKGK